MYEIFHTEAAKWYTVTWKYHCIVIKSQLCHTVDTDHIPNKEIQNYPADHHRTTKSFKHIFRMCAKRHLHKHIYIRRIMYSPKQNMCSAPRPVCRTEPLPEAWYTSKNLPDCIYIILTSHGDTMPCLRQTKNVPCHRRSLSKDKRRLYKVQW